MTSVCYLTGNTYDHKENIKSIRNKKGDRIFRWDVSRKEWIARDVPDEAIDRLAEIVKQKCLGVDLHVKTPGET